MLLPNCWKNIIAEWSDTPKSQAVETGFVDSLTGFGKGAANAALSNETITSLQSAIAGKVVNFAGGNVNLKSVISRTTGQVLNPNQELLFEGPTLRSFSFVFDIAPRFSEEGLEVMKMIRFLRNLWQQKQMKAPEFSYNHQISLRLSIWVVNMIILSWIDLRYVP